MDDDRNVLMQATKDCAGTAISLRVLYRSRTVRCTAMARVSTPRAGEVHGSGLNDTVGALGRARGASSTHRGSLGKLVFLFVLQLCHFNDKGKNEVWQEARRALKAPLIADGS